jgi:hypothetical protein
MAGFLRWLAPRYEEVRHRLSQEHAEFRDRAAGGAGHARTPGIVADLALGLRYFLDFAVDVGAVTPAEREELARRGWQALSEAAEQQVAEIAGQDPATRFLQLVAAAIASGRVHLTDREGRPPRDPEQWGWRGKERTYRGEGGCPETGADFTPQGRQIGWVAGEDIYLEPEAAYAEVQRLAEDQGEPLPVTQRQLHKRLNERGHVASAERGKLTNRRTLQGRERTILHLRQGALTPQEPGEPGDSGESPQNSEGNGACHSPVSGDSPGYFGGSQDFRGTEPSGNHRENNGIPPVRPVPPKSSGLVPQGAPADGEFARERAAIAEFGGG